MISISARRAIVVLLLTAPAPCLSQVAQLTPVVGLWRAQDAQGPALTTDGAAWDGKTTTATLSTAAQQLFGRSLPEFVTNGTSSGAFPLAVARNIESFSSGTLRVQFQMVSGPTDQSGGIVFDLAPSGAYRFVRYNTKDGNIALWGYVAGERQVIAKGEGLKQLPLGEWHELVVRINGLALSASIVGHPELNFSHTLDRVPSGRIGLWAKRDVVTVFKGLRVDR